jgi:hypothetical protein
MSEMKRLVANSVSEALISVVEQADDLDQVVIFYRYKQPKEELPEKEGCEVRSYGMSQNSEMKVEELNFLIDTIKYWLFGG